MNIVSLEFKGLVDIIILQFNTPEYDKECLKAIIDNTEYPYYQVSLFNNYYPRFSISKIWNMLIARSYGEYICLLNNDTRPAEGWLRKLVEVFEWEDKIGAVGPSTNRCGSHQKVKSPINDYQGIVDYGKEFGEINQLSGFCILFPKEVWSSVGGFDERFGVYAQENEFLHRVRQSGFRTMWRPDAYVWHAGEASAKKLQEKGEFNITEERKKGQKVYRRAIGES